MTGAYTTVIDGGSLEHVFNFPQAIANCMNMVAVGGHFIGLSPANNFLWAWVLPVQRRAIFSNC